MKLSIIIAAYNIERYIGKCISRCITAGEGHNADFEIIVVNDGSTDSTERLINDYVEKYENVSLVNRTNGGLSAARNTGLKYAKGKYVWFVDGDDLISVDAISILLSYINTKAVDAYIIGFSTFEDGTDELNSGSRLSLPQGEFNPREYLSKNRTLMPFMAWQTIFSRAFLKTNQLIFKEGIFHEDIEFSVRAFILCESALALRMPLYQYRLNRPGSIMAELPAKMMKTLESYIEIEKSWNDFIRERNISRKRFNSSLAFVSQLIRFNAYYTKIKSSQTKGEKLRLLLNIFRGGKNPTIRYILFKLLPRKLFHKRFPAYNSILE